MTGKYTVTIYNLGNRPVIIGVIAGITLLILDSSRIVLRTETTLPSSSSATTNTETQPIVLASWISRFIA